MILYYLSICDSDMVALDVVLVCKVQINVKVQEVGWIKIGDSFLILPLFLSNLSLQIVDHILHFSLLLDV
jgi:hypothetical protein